VHVIFTDLDGTLLDHDTYSFEPARPALDRLQRAGVPVVFTSSKTRTEIEALRRHTANHHPFIPENGGALFVPTGYFPFPLPGARRTPNYNVIEYGAPYHELTTVLHEASKQSGCAVRGWSSLTVSDIAAVSGLGIEHAELAKCREYDEPFEILGTPAEAGALLEAIEKRGFRWTRGGRFYHIVGDNDKANAVQGLIQLYKRVHGEVTSVGLGDSRNDVEFLNVVDVPILVRSHSTEKIQAAVQFGRVTAAWGPSGWNEAILEMFPE
jgi:mannosyl-3-phosphoglycerate phosphatase